MSLRVQCRASGGRGMRVSELKSVCPHLERHLGELIKNGHVEHQAPQQVLQHGRADVPGGHSAGGGLSPGSPPAPPRLAPPCRAPPAPGAYLQSAMRQSSMTSRCALVRERPRESRYTVCSMESTMMARCSVPAKSGAHLVMSGSTARHRYLFSASAISVVLNVAWGAGRGLQSSVLLGLPWHSAGQLRANDPGFWSFLKTCSSLSTLLQKCRSQLLNPH